MCDNSSRFGFPLLGTLVNVQRGYMNLMEKAVSWSLETMTQQAELVMNQSAKSLDFVRRSQESFGGIITPIISATVPREFYRPTTTASTVSERNEEVIPVGEEILIVGKRLVEGEKTRIHRTVTESPVEQAVQLVSQTVTIERRRPANAERASDVLSNKTVEMFDVKEVPVVSKGVRLIEEVVIRKETSSHTETIHDTVKRDSVEVQQPQRMPVLYGSGKDQSDSKSHRNHESRQERAARNNGPENRAQQS